MKYYDCYNMKNALRVKCDALSNALDAAEDADKAAWDWYDALTEEEYYAAGDAADNKVDETSRQVKRLREQVEEVENAIRLLDKLEDSLQFLEDEGVI